jgi:hypothetical protein
MGLLSSFNTGRQNFDVNAADSKLIVDLSLFVIGATPLGKPPWDGDFFSIPLQKKPILKLDELGYEIGVEDGALDYVFLTIENFQGAFLLKKEALPININTTSEEVIDWFGEPYWTDLDDDGEVILFYEYQNGTIELQFEFPNGKSLAYITLTRDGVLSTKEQRESYGVTKPWPPEKKE